MKYTEKGHKLEVGPLRGAIVTFSCRSKTLWADGSTSTKIQEDWIVSQLHIFFPVTVSMITNIVIAWLSAFNDQELIAEAPKVIREYLDSLGILEPFEFKKSAKKIGQA